MMNAYLVGGAVRDILMGRAAQDQDWVVVGSTPEQMLELGFLPVGRDFPVFLHPQTREEHALARTERKTGRGYRGFAVCADPSVTLEEDLGRRDLTINAIAVDDTDHLVDPFGGQADIENKVLRHVRAQSFVEDPVRVLRLARFAARYTDFQVAGETLQLCQAMVAEGELDHLVAERVWQELAKGLMEPKPSRMFEVLRECGALRVLLPELDALWGVPQPAAHHPEVDTGVHVMMALDLAAQEGASLEVRFAVLTHDLGKGLTPADVLPAHHGHEAAGVPLVQAVAQRLRVPRHCEDLAVLVTREHTHVHRCKSMRNGSVVSLLERLDAFRRPARLHQVVQACAFDARGRLGLSERSYAEGQHLLHAFEAARSVDVGAVVAQNKDKRFLPEQIHAARTHALAHAWAQGQRQTQASTA